MTGEGRAGSAVSRRVGLIVGDADTREALTRLLELEGLEVTVTGAGDEPSPDVDVHLVDLPGAEGFAVADRLRPDGVGPPVVVLGTTPAGDRLVARSGARYLRRPVDLEHLIAALVEAG